MLKLIFAPEHGFESDARQRVRDFLQEQPSLPPIPSVSRARFPALCANCYQNTVWPTAGGETECDECREARFKAGELDEELAERTRQPVLF